jgi:flagellin
VAKERGAIGSTMNRLSAGLSNLESTRVNIASAAGRILDVDVAGESARLVRSQILQQTAAAVLAQANQSPNLALQLLRS